MQKDKAFVTDCRSPILAHVHESGRDLAFGDYEFDAERFALPWDAPSVVVCLDVARLFGCRAVIYLACDSAVGDYRTYRDGQTYLPAHADQYAAHPDMIAQRAAQIGMPYSYLTL